MKNVKKIKLHNLSQAEMADKEMNLLKGGSGLPGYCISICLDAICKCPEDSSGVFTTDYTILETHDSSSTTQEDISNAATEDQSGSGVVIG